MTMIGAARLQAGLSPAGRAVRIDDDLAEFEQIWRELRYRSPF